MPKMAKMTSLLMMGLCKNISKDIYDFKSTVGSVATSFGTPTVAGINSA